MTLADLRIPCGHRRYEAHGMVGFEDDAVVVYDRSDCPGGRSATIEDLIDALDDDYRVFTRALVATWRFCPRCGRPNIDQEKRDGVEQCLPTNCDSWVHESTFDHRTRQWVPSGVTAEEE